MEPGVVDAVDAHYLSSALFEALGVSSSLMDALDYEETPADAPADDLFSNARLDSVVEHLANSSPAAQIGGGFPQKDAAADFPPAVEKGME